jgi:uncharacterized protein (DUF2344 family)
MKRSSTIMRAAPTENFTRTCGLLESSLFEKVNKQRDLTGIGSNCSSCRPKGTEIEMSDSPNLLESGIASFTRSHNYARHHRARLRGLLAVNNFCISLPPSPGSL